jgi:hypothetical protein
LISQTRNGQEEREEKRKRRTGGDAGVQKDVNEDEDKD